MTNEEAYRSAAEIYAEVADEPLGDLGQRRPRVQEQWREAVLRAFEAVRPKAAAQRAAIATLDDAAEAIAWQAGVGGRETAGAIVSYLATSPDEIEPFFAGKLSPIDFAGDWMRGGRLSWQGADGKVWTPEAAAAARTARDAGLEPMSAAAEAQLA